MECLSYIDVDMQSFLVECATIGFWTKGAFPFPSLKELPFDEFEIVLKESLRIQEAHKRALSGGGDELG